jgi:Kef-type K+ transport system membrane component KefB
MLDNVFNQIAILLLISSVVGVIFIWLRQPLILAFIAVGIIVGPSGFGIVYSASEVDLFAKIGITLLLFIVGLRLDFQLIQSLGKVSLFTGMGQVFFTAGIGYLIALLLGISPIAATYIAVALTFSSTIIIVKLLSDKEEIDSLYGRIAVGFLIVQDIVVILAIIVLSSFGVGKTSHFPFGLQIFLLLLKGLGLLLLVGLLARFVFPKFLGKIAASRELLVIFAIAWAVILATGAETLGFSKEVGGFLAGVSLASTSYREAIASRLETLRNFLLLFFFIDLGAHIKLDLINTQIIPAMIFSLFVLIGNPLIVMAIMGLMGYKKRTGFMAGLTVAQISEFSLILGALGVSLGHINNQTMAIITLVGVITIGVSTYMILYNHVLYRWFESWLAFFEKKHPDREEFMQNQKKPFNAKLILFGLGRYGSNLIQDIKKLGVSAIGVDFDPERLKNVNEHGFDVRYGDAEDIEFIKILPLKRIKCIISTIPHQRVNLILLHALSENDYQGKVVLTVHTQADLDFYAKFKFDLLLMPYRDAAYLAADKVIKLIGEASV